MPETFLPLVWHNNQAPAINETNLNRVEVGLQSVDARAAALELGIVAAVTVPYATSITLNATQGSLFRCVAAGDITLDSIVGGTDGQTIVLEVQASGADRVLAFTGPTASVTIPSGQWRMRAFRFAAASNAWRMVELDSGDNDPGQYGVKTHNARGDGVTDDTAAISAAMDAANAAGKTLFFPPGTYRCGSITKAYAPRIHAVPGTVTILATNTSSYTWTFAGSLGSTVAVSASVARNALSLTCASTTGLAAGDLILIGDTQVSYATQSTRRHGQLAQISTVDSGTAVTLTDAAYTAFATASSAVIAKVTAPSGARIAGLRFLNTNSASTGGFVRCQYLRDVGVDIDGEGSGAAGVRLEHCYDFQVRTVARNYYDNAGASQFGYAVEAAGACSHGQVTVHATKVRHAFTCGGIDNTYGEPLNIRVTGVAHGCTAQSWDAHAQGSQIVFVDCQSFAPRSYHFALRGVRQRIAGGYGQGGYGGVWCFEAAQEISITGLRVSDVAASDAADASGAGGRGIRVQNAIAGLTVSNVDLLNIARDGIVLDSTGTDVTISGGVIRNVGLAGSGGGQSAVHAVGSLTRARVRDLVVADDQATKTTIAAVTLDATSTDVLLRDNLVQQGITRLSGSGAAGTSVDAVPAGMVGNYAWPNPSPVTTSTSPGIGTLRVSPWLLTETITIDRIGSEIVVAGDAGSTLRLVIYADRGDAYPGSLLLDGGTIAADSATAQDTAWTGSLTLLPGLYWAGGVVQGVTVTQPTTRIPSNWTPPVSLTTGTAMPTAAQVATGYLASGVTGSPPTTWPTNVSPAGSAPRIHFRRSA